MWTSGNPVLIPLYGLLNDEDVPAFVSYLYRIMGSNAPIYSGFRALEYSTNRLVADPYDHFTDSEKAILDSVYYVAWYKLQQVCTYFQFCFFTGFSTSRIFIVENKYYVNLY